METKAFNLNTVQILNWNLRIWYQYFWLILYNTRYYPLNWANQVEVALQNEDAELVIWVTWKRVSATKIHTLHAFYWLSKL